MQLNNTVVLQLVIRSLIQLPLISHSIDLTVGVTGTEGCLPSDVISNCEISTFSLSSLSSLSLEQSLAHCTCILY